MFVDNGTGFASFVGIFFITLPLLPLCALLLLCPARIVDPVNRFIICLLIMEQG
jgi:hypothetical protein